MKKLIISLALAFALPSLVLAYFQPATLTNGVSRVAVYTKAQADNLFGNGYTLDGASNVGASSGQNHSFLEKFNGGIVTGGGRVTFTATSTESAKTMPISWIANYNQIDIAAVAAGLALTLTSPSTTTLSGLLPNIGDTKEIYLRNLNAAATTTTIVAGSGVDLRIGEETGADVIIDGLNNAVLTFRRVSATVVSLIVNEEVVGD